MSRSDDLEHLRLLAIFHYLLGAFSLIVLSRDSVKRLYGRDFPAAEVI